MGRSGGILTFWDKNKFECSSQWSFGGAVVVVGREKVTGEACCVVNIMLHVRMTIRSSYGIG